MAPKKRRAVVPADIRKLIRKGVVVEEDGTYRYCGDGRWSGRRVRMFRSRWIGSGKSKGSD
jgi:hypothetical protein